MANKLHRPSEGMRRLAIILGIVVSAAWIIITAVESNGFDHMERHEWVIFVIGIQICFGLGFGAIWAIDWVISGFREGRK
jgi:hypothetical protein